MNSENRRFWINTFVQSVLYVIAAGIIRLLTKTPLTKWDIAAFVAGIAITPAVFTFCLGVNVENQPSLMKKLQGRIWLFDMMFSGYAFALVDHDYVHPGWTVTYGAFAICGLFQLTTILKIMATIRQLASNEKSNLTKDTSKRI